MTLRRQLRGLNSCTAEWYRRWQARIYLEDLYHYCIALEWYRRQQPGTWLQSVYSTVIVSLKPTEDQELLRTMFLFRRQYCFRALIHSVALS